MSGWCVANGNEVHDRPTHHDESGARIGETPNRIVKVEYPYDDTAGQNATAYLIAAAPDLYAALEDAFFALGRAGANVLGGIYRDEWEAARAALARARGEEPAP